jgi:hypothetical protein
MSGMDENPYEAPQSASVYPAPTRPRRRILLAILLTLLGVLEIVVAGYTIYSQGRPGDNSGPPMPLAFKTIFFVIACLPGLALWRAAFAQFRGAVYWTDWR